MKLPSPRGPISSAVLDMLGETASTEPATLSLTDPLDGDDFHLALYLCYEPHYTSIYGVEAEMEWDPGLLQMRRRLEVEFEEALQALVPRTEATAEDVIDKVQAAIAADEAPSVASYIETSASLDEVKEFLIHRSAYQLKEADPHTWLIPRIRTEAKAMLVEIQADEYGGGRPDRIHSLLFAKAMRALGLDDSYGSYLEQIPGVTLATVNLVSMFGLHRRLRGAGVGHLAVFETMSAGPNGRYSSGLRRLGFDGDAVDFFDEHVEADSVHEVIAMHDLIGLLVRDEPELAPDVLWGARCLLALDAIWARKVLGDWQRDGSSLRMATERADAR